GQHTDQHVGPHPVGRPMANRAHIQVHALEAAKGSLDGSQALIGAYRIFSTQPLGTHRGANHVEPIHARILVDALLVALVAKLSLANLPTKVLRHGGHAQRPAHPVTDALRSTVVAGAASLPQSG